MAMFSEILHRHITEANHAWQICDDIVFVRHREDGDLALLCR
jgi:hypothetical protein